MCGIAGLMTTSGAAPPAEPLEKFLAALAHRGPDGQGRYRSGPFAMVQTRLAIIDLETGDQPIYGPGGAALVANGEIYNYRELRDELTGHQFTTRSDCEPPLHLWRRDGVDFARHLRGMYATAIYDPTAEALVLARDPFGIKPLYYAETGNFLAFASEPRALLEAGIVPRGLSPRPRDELLQLQFSTGVETPFTGIRRVLPGEILTIGAGRIVSRRRISALPEGGPANWSEAEALERLDAALMDSIEMHQRSDVPYGLFLSGGIDSSVVLSLMARSGAAPVRAYTVGFPGTGVHDEREHARELAKRVGAEHIEVEVTEQDFWSLLPEIAAAVDDPTADYALLPTYKLAAEAGKDVKVILSGEGGDELFAGYGRYRSTIRPWWLGGRAMRSRGIFDRLGVLRQEPTGWRDGIVAAESTLAAPDRSRLQEAQAVDCADWLPNDLLIKLDRCLMAHGVEGRTPFLDPKVAEVAFHLPDELKIQQGRGKYLLRKWLERHLPEANAFERKRGFTVPVGEWIGRRGTELGPLIAAQPGIVELCVPERVIKLFRNPDKHQRFAAWTLLFYALWHRRHILGLPSAGDVFETLASTH
jgi:asparagine synthase (glutamine-hydrolysing)